MMKVEAYDHVDDADSNISYFSLGFIVNVLFDCFYFQIYVD